MQRQMTTATTLTATYRVRTSAADIEARAKAIAVEQSVEMPLSAIDDTAVLENIVGVVHEIVEVSAGIYDVAVQLAAATSGPEPGQLLNILFGNTSIHDDVTLQDVDLPASFATHFNGPDHGLDGLRERVGAGDRALTCSALKPQGMPPVRLAELAHRLALGGLDYIKDDHGLADQSYSPFAERIQRVAEAVARANNATGRCTRYIPSLTGTLDDMRAQVAQARAAGLDTVMVAPMVSGVSTFHRMVAENADLAFMAHPALAGAARIAPPAHFGKLFRLFGADCVVFPNHGGRFGYSADTCRAIADASLRPWLGMKSAVPVPAGGMTLERVPEILDFYGSNVMLLVGGSLLSAGVHIPKEAAAFQRAVEGRAR